MRHFARATLWLAVLFTSCALAAGAPERRVEELMRESGLWAQVGQFEGLMKLGVRNAAAQAQPGAGKLDAKQHAQLERAIEIAFAPDAVRQSVAADLARLVSVEDEVELLGWLRSDLGRRITRLEEEGTEPAAVERAMHESPALLAAASAQRRSLYDRLATATKAGKSGADMELHLMSGVAYGVVAASRFPDARVLEKIAKGFEAQRAALEDAMLRQTLGQYAYIYQQVSDADLERYIEVVESPAGMRFTDATIAAVDRALKRGAIEVGERFGAELPGTPERRS